MLDPALTLAAAGAGNVDGTRLPNEAMMQAIAAAKDESSNISDSSYREEEASAVESTTELTAQPAGRFEFQEARGMQEKRRLELAGENIGDHAVTLAAYQVRSCFLRSRCQTGLEACQVYLHVFSKQYIGVFTP